MRISELGIPLAVSAKSALKNKTQSSTNNLATATPDPKDQTSAQGTVGTIPAERDPNDNTTNKTPPIGSNTSNQNTAKFMRGTEVDVPNADNPNAPEKYIVKAVQGDEVELKPKTAKQGLPKSIKFSKKDLAQ
jgi:hypothetical protein